MYELLDVHSILTPGVIDDFENLKSYHDSIRSLDKVATYLKSKQFRVLTLNGLVTIYLIVMIHAITVKYFQLFRRRLVET